jgi:hypothetical protein
MSGSAGMELLQKRTMYFAQTDDLSATGENIHAIAFANPIDIYRFGYVADTAVVIDAGGLAASLECEVVGGTNRVSGSVLNLVDADDHAAGIVVYTDVIVPVAEGVITGAPGIGGQKRNVGPAGPFHVFPGEQVLVNVTNAGTSGTVRWWIEYAEQPIVGVPTVPASGSGTTDAQHYMKR